MYRCAGHGPVACWFHRCRLKLLDDWRGSIFEPNQGNRSAIGSNVMSDQQHQGMVSRRTALAGIGIGGLGLALATKRAVVSAQDASADLASHPIVGSWLVTVPTGPDTPPVANSGLYSPDGSVVNMAPVTRMGPQDVSLASGAVGRWESAVDRVAHFTMVQMLSSPEGVFIGTVTIDGNPTVSDDGMTFTDDSPESTVTVRDPAGNVVSAIEGARVQAPITAVRIAVGAPGFPEATPVS
jgi:hypothetical protein